MMGDEVKWEIFTPFGSSFWVRVRFYHSKKKKKKTERERERDRDRETDKEEEGGE
jgi:hypothetical protein